MKSDLFQELDFLIARMRAIGTSRANRALRPHGLKVRSYSVLSLACSSTPPTQRQLAELLSLDPSQIVPLVDELEQRQLVSRVPDPSDRRSKIIVASTSGHELYAAARQATKNSEDRTLRALSDHERDQLRLLLSRVIDSVKSEDDSL